MTPLLFIVILAIIVLFSSAMTVLWKNENTLTNILIKCVINFVIIYLAAMSFALNKSTSDLFESLILLGLVASMIADIVLNLEKFDEKQSDKKTTTIQNFVLTTKVVSAFTFMVALVYFTTTSWLIGFTFGGFFAIFTIFIDKLFKINLQKYKYILPIYAFIFGVLISQSAAQLILVDFNTAVLLALIGFVLLLVADLILITNFIVKAKTENEVNKNIKDNKKATVKSKTTSQTTKNSSLTKEKPQTTVLYAKNFTNKIEDREVVGTIIYYLSQIIIASLIFFI
ncbi:MAG: lysoplasmalogenase family protein [Clostridia bacterium]|nr:lysoplasmalogenase family protein [Clostridia bacterium]